MVTALAHNPVITTVIPTYQRPRLLERAIRSVLNQTYPRFQVCVYDNASEDETKEVVAKLMKEDPRVKYFCHSSNIGVGPNFNYGLSRIETQYFSILSDDDVLIPNFFESALEKLAHYPNAMLVAGLCLIVDNNAVLAVSPDYLGSDEYFIPPQSLIEIAPNPPTWTSILFRKEVIERIGTLDFETSGASDQDFEFRIAARYPIILTKQPWALYYVHAGATSARSLTTMIEKRVFAIKKLIEKIAADDRTPLDVRVAVVQKLQGRCKIYAYAEGLKAVRWADYEYAYQMAHTLDTHFKEKDKARIIRQLIFLRKYFAIGYSAVSLLGRIKGRIYYLAPVELRRRNNHKGLQTEYGSYLRFLG
jgi:glycosyltransferase involved in cell wall biosynthesis